ncbi:MAG: VOC family protein, partial [Pseudomonadota bacterium]
GITRLHSGSPEEDGAAFTGYGADHPFFWIVAERATRGMLHIAIRASDRGQVDDFHAAALQAGGRDNGAPGLRPHYHAHYYGAFVFDPDGHNIEAVCHIPEG